ncbi:MAG: D-2-hydroxyacid dehydrogenase [Halanaerobiales bacterium]
MKLVINFDIKDKYIEKMKKTVQPLEVVRSVDSDSLKREIVDTDILVSFGAPDLEIMDRAENLKWIQSWTAGVDVFTGPDYLQFLIENEIILTSMSGVHSNIIAEHTMGFLINFSRRFCDFHQQQQNQVWQQLKVDQLEGRTLGVVGLGSIGREIAARGKAFKMTVIGSKRNVEKKVKAVDELYSPDELSELLRKSDYVVCIVPLTDETAGMFGKEEFKAMKDSAYFINVGRGEVVDQDALIEALKQGRIAGAGLDVFDKEPLPEDSPLYRLKNVIITPHVAGVFPDYNQKAIKILNENLKKFYAGDFGQMVNMVDYNRGY